LYPCSDWSVKLYCDPESDKNWDPADFFNVSDSVLRHYDADTDQVRAILYDFKHSLFWAVYSMCEGTKKRAAFGTNCLSMERLLWTAPLLFQQTQVVYSLGTEATNEGEEADEKSDSESEYIPSDDEGSTTSSQLDDLGDFTWTNMAFLI